MYFVEIYDRKPLLSHLFCYSTHFVIPHILLFLQSFERNHPLSYYYFCTLYTTEKETITHEPCEFFCVDAFRKIVNFTILRIYIHGHIHIHEHTYTRTHIYTDTHIHGHTHTRTKSYTKSDANSLLKRIST